MQVEPSNRHLVVIFYEDFHMWDEIVVSPEDFLSVEAMLLTCLAGGTLAYIGKSTGPIDFAVERTVLSSVSAFHCFSSSLRHQLALKIGKLELSSAVRPVTVLDGTLSTGSYNDRDSLPSIYYHTLLRRRPIVPEVSFMENLTFRALHHRDDDSGDELWDIYAQLRDLCGEVLTGKEPLGTYLERVRYLNSYIIEDIEHVGGCGV